MESKKFWLSKTFWVNVLASVGFAVQARYGFVVSPALQGMILSSINLGLRKITKQPVKW